MSLNSRMPTLRYRVAFFYSIAGCHSIIKTGLVHFMQPKYYYEVPIQGLEPQIPKDDVTHQTTCGCIKDHAKDLGGEGVS